MNAVCKWFWYEIIHLDQQLVHSYVYLFIIFFLHIKQQCHVVISCKKCFEYFLVYNGNVDDVYITVQFLDIFAKLQKLQKNSKSLQGGTVSRSQLSNLLRNNSTLTPFPVMSFPEMIWIFTCVYNATLVTFTSQDNLPSCSQLFFIIRLVNWITIYCFS